MSYWDMIWSTTLFCFFLGYLYLLFSVIMDLIRNPDQSGLAKAVWVVALLLLPLFGALAYMVAHGSDTSSREYRARQAVRNQQTQARALGGAAPRA